MCMELRFLCNNGELEKDLESGEGKIKIQELQGIEEGLLLAKRREIARLIIFTYSGEAIHLLNKNGHRPWQARRIVERIKKLVLSFTVCIIVQVFREANAAADNLAKSKT
ncbi:hypothetical protein GIB67_012971 [Kingdonia uniflora]|uniref:RNase H type-1 domain-containing protein n=1 Tax=Kingdonia uniflora TaxID=39325 RepID=A0A7J7LXT4_9MAGN|nr:hypothetical protein GIB67_012971 [Kingdonia uniflora]